VGLEDQLRTVLTQRQPEMGAPVDERRHLGPASEKQQAKSLVCGWAGPGNLCRADAPDVTVKQVIQCTQNRARLRCTGPIKFERFWRTLAIGSGFARDVHVVVFKNKS
jgi:hypothetical protein